MNELEWVVSQTTDYGDAVKWNLVEHTDRRTWRVAQVVNVVTWWKVELYNQPDKYHYFKTEEEAKAVAVALVRLN